MNCQIDDNWQVIGTDIRPPPHIQNLDFRTHQTMVDGDK